MKSAFLYLFIWGGSLWRFLVKLLLWDLRSEHWVFFLQTFSYEVTDLTTEAKRSRRRSLIVFAFFLDFFFLYCILHSSLLLWHDIASGCSVKIHLLIVRIEYFYFNLLLLLLFLMIIVKFEGGSLLGPLSLLRGVEAVYPQNRSYLWNSGSLRLQRRIIRPSGESARPVIIAPGLISATAWRGR